LPSKYSWAEINCHVVQGHKPCCVYEKLKLEKLRAVRRVGQGETVRANYGESSADGWDTLYPRFAHHSRNEGKLFSFLVYKLLARRVLPPLEFPRISSPTLNTPGVAQ
jgi:hypothetical protein